MHYCPGWGLGAGVEDQEVLRAGREEWSGEVWVGGAATSGWGHSLLQAQHLLSLVLVVIHLSTVRQPLIPRLLEGDENVKQMLGCTE